MSRTSSASRTASGRAARRTRRWTPSGNNRRFNGGWVLEIEIRKYFDAMDHRHLHAIFRRRVRDGVLLRLIGKWLKAGVQEDGRITHPEPGSPQGGVISPLLATAYLHEAPWTHSSSGRSNPA